MARFLADECSDFIALNGVLSVAISKLLNDIGADGINFDTLENAPAEFRQASDATGHALALEPQFEPRDESLSWTNIAWNDWVTWEGKQYPLVPMVDKNRWFEARHTVAVTDRFTRDKTDSLQHAFFNGEGYAVLENLWEFPSFMFLLCSAASRAELLARIAPSTT